MMLDKSSQPAFTLYGIKNCDTIKKSPSLAGRAENYLPVS